MSATNWDVQILSVYVVRDVVALTLFTLLRKLLIFNKIHENAMLCLCLRLQCLWFWKRVFIAICDFGVHLLRFLCLWLLLCLWFQIFRKHVSSNNGLRNHVQGFALVACIVHVCPLISSWQTPAGWLGPLRRGGGWWPWMVPSYAERAEPWKKIPSFPSFITSSSASASTMHSIYKIMWKPMLF